MGGSLSRLLLRSASSAGADSTEAYVESTQRARTDAGADVPSHLQQVYAEVVSRLPVPDEQGGAHHAPPHLRTNAEYHAYIRQRTEAWKASRRAAPANNS